MEPLDIITVIDFSYISVRPSFRPYVCGTPFFLFEGVLPSLFKSILPSHFNYLHYLDSVDTLDACGHDGEVYGVW